MHALKSLPPPEPKKARRLQTVLALAGVATVFLARSAAFGQDPNFQVYLCLGQSNMEGFPGIEARDRGPVDERFQVLAAVDFAAMGRSQGKWSPAAPPLCRPSTGLCPADYFGRTLVSRLPAKTRVGIVNVAVAGAKIEVFDQQRAGDYLKTAPDWLRATAKQYGDDPYRRLVELARTAQKDGVIKGILLHQGESNTGDATWPEQVKTIYDRLLADLGLRAENVPLLAGELAGRDQNGACAAMNAIIDKLPATIPTAHVVSSEGCAVRPDRLHFTAEGYRKLGERYAAAMLSLLPGGGADGR